MWRDKHISAINISATQKYQFKAKAFKDKLMQRDKHIYMKATFDNIKHKFKAKHSYLN